jgi:hypothetical protein
MYGAVFQVVQDVCVRAFFNQPGGWDTFNSTVETPSTVRLEHLQQCG